MVEVIVRDKNCFQIQMIFIQRFKYRFTFAGIDDERIARIVFVQVDIIDKSVPFRY